MKKIVLFFVFSSLIFSAEFTVSTIEDFQNALTSSESNGQDDTIYISAGTYTFSSQLVFTSTEAYDLSIIGTGDVLLDGNSTSQIIKVTSSTGKISFNNLRFENGYSATDTGGAIYIGVNTRVDILNSIFKNNRVDSGSGGGAIWIEAYAKDLVIINSIFHSGYSVYGGAFRINGYSDVIIINSTFYQNSGGASNGQSIFPHSGAGVLAINSIFDTAWDIDGRYNTNTITAYNTYLDTSPITSAITSFSNVIFSGLSWSDTTNLVASGSSTTTGSGMPLSTILTIVDENVSQILNDNYSSYPNGFLNMGANLEFSAMSSLGSVLSASLDLTFYDKIRVKFNMINEDTITNLSSEISSDEVFVKNSDTTDKVYLNFDFNESNSAYLSVRDQNGINIIKSNSLNNLQLHLNDSVLDDSNISADFNLTKTLGSTQFGDLNVYNDTWNLITIPQGLHTNSREIIRQGKATMIWGWEHNGTSYNWIPYPKKMVAGRGYWVRTRVPQNTNGNLSNIIATEYNSTVLGDYNNSEINTSNLTEVVSLIPKKEKWVLLGNSGFPASIAEKMGIENNSTKYYFGDLLNNKEECYFVSIYHWKPEIENWINDTSDGNTSEPIPFGAGFWTKQRLCNK
ncbi:hypothetical protein ThvES_00015830 [Thiovulum sp. ES]|nr:hypothetical protein ThvES_00015830 [Thiovulum sp. ES]